MTDLIAELAEVVRLDSLCKSLPYNAKRADAYKDAAFEALGLIRAHAAEIEAMARDAEFLKVAETTLHQIATTPRNAGARRNANATMRFIETQRAAAMHDSAREGGE